MLSGESNAGEGLKTTIGLISKKATLHVQHTFLYISLPWFCTTITWNFQKLLSFTFSGGNVIRVLVHFFSAAHFHLAFDWWPLAFLTAATKFSCCSFNKKISPFFISRSRSLSPFFSLSSAGLPPTFSFSPFFSSFIFQICGDDS